MTLASHERKLISIDCLLSACGAILDSVYALDCGFVILQLLTSYIESNYRIGIWRAGVGIIGMLVRLLIQKFFILILNRYAFIFLCFSFIKTTLKHLV
jgi:hypothetical protein